MKFYKSTALIISLLYSFAVKVYPVRSEIELRFIGTIKTFYMLQFYGNFENNGTKRKSGDKCFAPFLMVWVLIALQFFPLQNIMAQNLDLLGLSSPAASAAFSLRKVNSLYTGPSIRVKRGGDNAEADVAFDGSNEISASSIVKFIPGIVLSNTASFSVKTGSLTAVSGSLSVTGVGTNFTTQLAAGNILVDETSKTTIGIIAGITDNTHLTLSAAAAISSTGAGQFRALPGTQTFSSFYAGTSCFVQTWYDQSGNGKDAFQNLAGNSRPMIVNAGIIQVLGGKPTILWQASSQFLTCNSNTPVQTVNAVRNLYNTDPGGDKWQTLFAAPASSDFSIRLGYAAPANGNDWVSGTGATPTNWVNGNQTTKGTLALHTLTASAAAPKNSSFSISSSFYDRGLSNNIGVSEMIVFPGVLTPAERQTLDCNQLKYFSIINTILAVPNQNIAACSGTPFLSAPGAANVSYTWTSPLISPAAAITGGSAQATPVSIFSQSLVNATASPATATYLVTPSLCGTNGTPFTVTVTVNPLPAKPAITINYCTGTGFVELTSSTGTGYLWSTGQTSRVINVNSAGSYSVSTSMAPYGCAATISTSVATELAVNGSFDAGNTGFSTTYQYDPNNTIPEGNYSVRTDAHLTHYSFYGKDHTTGNGNFMIVNGKPAPAGEIVWAQSNITVLPNTTYYFSAWGLSLLDDNNAVLQFKINGFQSGSVAYLPRGYTNQNGPFTWVRFFGVWNSGPSTTANISIIDLNTLPNGNDFGLDDISFGTLSPVILAVTPVANSGNAVCQGGFLKLTANLVGGASPYTYAWTGPNAFSSTNQNPTVTNTAGAVNSGLYTLTARDGFNCPVTATTTVTIAALPADKTPVAQVASLCAGGQTNITIPVSESGVSYQLKDGGNINVGDPVGGNGGIIDLPTGILNATTTFTVLATTDNTGCDVQMSAPVTVTIYATPVLAITNQAVCAAIPVNLTAAAVTAGSTGGGTLSYWADAAATAALPSPANITVSGTYYIQSSVGTCSDTRPVAVSINSTPAAAISYATPFCSTGANPRPTFVSGGVAGIFSAPAGLVFVSKATGQIDLSASTPGTYNITNMVAPVGCTPATATFNVRVTAIPKADFSYSSNALCKSINVPNQAPVGPGASAGSFSATFGLSYNSTSGVINIGASTPGNYAIWNNIAAANGCPAVSDTTFIDINPYINTGTVSASSSTDIICNGQTIDLFGVAFPYSSVLLREKFNSTVTNWQKFNNSTGPTLANAAWSAKANGYNDGSGAFNSNDNSGFYFTSSALNTGGNTDVSLKSATMSTLGFSSLSLDFFHYFKHTVNGIAKVEVSTNGSTWTSVATYNSTQGAQTLFANATVNLDSYIGLAAFYIRFKYDANADGCWAIDNVSITGNSKNYTYNWSSFPSGFSSTDHDPVGVSPTSNSFYILTTTNTYGCSQPSTPVPVTVLTAQTLSGVSQPLIACIGSGAGITLTGLLPNSNSTVGYSIAGVQQAPVVGLAANATGSASFTSSLLTAANNGQQLIITSLDYGTCSATFTKTVNLSVQTQVTWLGTNNSDWFDAQNWCGGVPTGSTSINIPNTANDPVLNAGAGAVKDITIQNGASLQVTNGKLSVSGSIIDNGLPLDAVSGTIEFNGVTAQTVKGSWFKNNSLGGLIVTNQAGLTVSTVVADSLNILDSLAFGAGNGVLNTGDNLVLASTATGTARLADITRNGAGNMINGKVTVQRYYPMSRSWRLVTSPLSNTGNIFNSWQDGAPVPYNPGKGMFVTGPTPSPANGLDASGFNNYSMMGWDGITGKFLNIGNTKSQLLSGNLVTPGIAANIGYYAFVRGDRRRSPDNTIIGNKNNTTLSSKGMLQTGIQTFNFSGPPRSLPLIGNPYASSVDFNKITKVHINPARFYVYDPSIGTLGAYVTMEEDGSNPGNFLPTTPNNSTQRNFIQSSQAFFVETDLSGIAASMVFNENNKSTNYNPKLFRPATPVSRRSSFRTNLFQVNSIPLQLDGNLVEFDDGFADKVDLQDALKFANITENLGILSDNRALSVERRQLIKDNDTIFLQLSGTTQRNYRLEFIPANLNPALDAFLDDSYTRMQTKLDITNASAFDFAVTADTNSAAYNRFRIVFKTVAQSPSAVTYKSIRAYRQAGDIAIDWTVENEVNISRYEVEKSADGVNFVKVNTTTATGANRISAGYQWIDANPFSGDNFYRIRSIGTRGSFEYSRAVLVKITSGGPAISIYPNPVTDNRIGLRFINSEGGVYTLQLLNSLGQTMLSKIISHATGTSMETIRPDYPLLPGIYQLKVTAPDKEVTTVKVIIRN